VEEEEVKRQESCAGGIILERDAKDEEEGVEEVGEMTLYEQQ